MAKAQTGSWNRYFHLHHFWIVIIIIANTYIVPTTCHRRCKSFIHNNPLILKRLWNRCSINFSIFQMRKQRHGKVKVTWLSKWQSQDSKPGNLVPESISSLLGQIKNYPKQQRNSTSLTAWPDCRLLAHINKVKLQWTVNKYFWFSQHANSERTPWCHLDLG